MGQSAVKRTKILKESKARQEADDGTIQYLNKTLQERNSGFARLISENEEQAKVIDERAKKIQRLERCMDLWEQDLKKITNFKQEIKTLKASSVMKQIGWKEDEEDGGTQPPNDNIVEARDTKEGNFDAASFGISYPGDRAGT
jgi:hypothetical protein